MVNHTQQHHCKEHLPEILFDLTILLATFTYEKKNIQTQLILEQLFFHL